jgi:hypothetical protein
MNTTRQARLIFANPQLLFANPAGRGYAPGSPPVREGSKHIVETYETYGEEGFLYVANDSLASACPDHDRGKFVPMQADWETPNIVRKYSAVSPNIIMCWRYVRTTDSFGDVSPLTLDIER